MRIIEIFKVGAEEDRCEVVTEILIRHERRTQDRMTRQKSGKYWN
jgi:hypothetical protein